MNVGYIKTHQWVITTHQEILSRDIQYDNEKPFETIQVNCAVEDDENMEYTYRKITSLVVYNTIHFHPNSTKRIQIEFGLGKEGSANTIISMIPLKQWKASISFEVNFLTSPFFKHNFLLFVNL